VPELVGALHGFKPFRIRARSLRNRVRVKNPSWT